MLQIVKKNIGFILFTICAGLIGGYALGLWQYSLLDPANLEAMQAQGLNQFTAALMTGVQSGLLYGGLLCILGLWLSTKAGLWRPVVFHTRTVLLAMGLGCLVGLLLFPVDGLVFGPFTEIAAWSNLKHASMAEWIGSILYGGVMEEVMLRLFLLSLIALLLKWIFARHSKRLPAWIGWTANITAALLFAAGHLRVTAALTALTPVVILRCFVLNGAGGLVFGWLYEKKGIQYAMIAHAMAHVFSKLLILLFI